jgi:hypothetical protein
MSEMAIYRQFDEQESSLKLGVAVSTRQAFCWSGLFETSALMKFMPSSKARKVCSIAKS